MIRMRIVFSGRVQGVGFRAAAAAVAAGRPVTGWVRNEQDGTVTLEAQGPQEAVERYLGDLRKRMAANIEHEDQASIETVQRETEFRVTG